MVIYSLFGFFGLDHIPYISTINSIQSRHQQPISQSAWFSLHTQPQPQKNKQFPNITTYYTEYPTHYIINNFQKSYHYFQKMHPIKIILLISVLIWTTLEEDPQQTIPSDDQIVLSIGQIIPGSINTAQSNQKIHLIHTNQLQKKYLFIRVITFQNPRMSIGLYSNQTRQLIYACQDTTFDSCYVDSGLLKPNITYAVLIIANENMKYNLYTYWGDLQHLKPNQTLKFMFEKLNPTQLFHLQFTESTKYEQIRLILKPEASRSHGDNLKILANRGFKQQPTLEKYDYKSMHVWADAQAIFLTKQDLKGQLGLAIYIIGTAQTVYTFECQFIEQRRHVLKMEEMLYQYVEKGKETFYQMNFKDNGGIDAFVIKLSVFTGQVQVGFFYDKLFTKLYERLPYQYMSDMQFNFDRIDFDKGTQQIFMKIRCPDSAATYQIVTQARKKQIAHQITQNVYQFSSLLDQRQAMYFYSHIWNQGQYQQSKYYRFDISSIRIIGTPIIQFYMCNPEIPEQQCKKPNDDNYFTSAVTKIKPIGVQHIGAKTINTIQLNDTVYKKLNQVEKRLMIIIVVSNLPNTTSAYAVQFSNPNKIRLLRQGRAFQDKVRYQQKKFYKYLNSNPSATQLRIHINQISGLTAIRAMRTNMLLQGGTNIPIHKELPDTIVVRDKVMQPIYIQVTGMVTSLYTISASALHSQHTVSNALVMAQDIQYQVKLNPHQHINVQLHPIQGDIIFEFYSQGGSINVCQVNFNDICQGDTMMGSHGQIKIDATTKRQIRIKIDNNVGNNNNNNNKNQLQNMSKQLNTLNRKVKLTLIYHAAGLNHCDQRRLNKVYSQNIKSGACFKYHLPLIGDIEIMASRSDLGDTFQLYFVCEKKIQPAEINDRYIIKAEAINKSCIDTPNDMNLQMVIGDNASQPKQQIKMDYSVQYNNDIITLADGVAYVSRGYSLTQTALRTFFYQIIDQQQNINIMLFNKKGNQRFMGSIVSKNDRYAGVNSQVQVSQAQASFSSRNSSYYINPYIQIKPEDIANSKCGKSCILIISIYSSQKPGSQIQYSLEVTQNHIYLRQNDIKKGFLPKGSVQFYEYQCRQPKGTLIFKISDNNRKCARSIMSKNPFPTGSNFLIKENQGTIIYEKTQKGTIYFSVEAIQDCPYSVTVSQQSINITKIQHGQFYDLKLDEGQRKWFYHRHMSKNSFKIISMKKHGQINIYANQSDLTRNTLQSLQKNTINIEQFKFKGWFKNTLIINSTLKQFCSGCYYLICVHATKLTETSIIIASSSTKIILGENKILFDQLQQSNSTTIASFYRVSDGQLQVKMHSGKIGFQMSYNNEKFSKTFTTNKKVYHQKYSFTQSYTYRPIQIKITAQEVPALYSFQLSPSINSTLSNHKLNPGQHTYVFLSQGATQCLTGTLTRKQQQIFISIDANQKLSLSTLNLTIKINELETQKYQQQIVGNIMSIKFKSQSQFFQKIQKYSICIHTDSINQSLSLFAFQSQNINLIHSDTEILIRKQNRFVLYPNTDIILDLFQCKGTAQLYYGRTLQTLKNKQSHKLNVIGIPGQSHAIRIQAFSVLYLDIIAEMATILWMPVNPKQERGVGYQLYSIGTLEYNSRFNTIDFKIGEVYQSKPTSTKPKLVKYTLLLSNSKQLLQQAVMCQQRTPKQKLLSATVNKLSVGSNSNSITTISLNKKRITDHFSNNQTIYFNVVADLTLQAPNVIDQQDHQHYRFIYFQQMVPSEVFRQNRFQSMDLILLITLIVVAVIAFLIISCVFVRYIVPALGVLKNRLFVQEKQDKDQSIPVPPSSDRNQVPGNQPATDQEFNKQG